MTKPSKHNHHGQPFARGATLIELSVTVGAVALLASMLLPVLGEARRQGKEVLCLHNLGQISDAGAVYAASDRNGLLIPVHAAFSAERRERVVYGWGGRSGRGDPLSGDYLDSIWGTANGLGPATRPMNRIIYGAAFPDYQNQRGPGSVNWIEDARLELDVYRCPADYGYTGSGREGWRDSKLTSFDHYGNSYAASTLWMRWNPGPSDILTLSAFLRPLSRIPIPARTIMYLENNGRLAWTRNLATEDCGASRDPPKAPIRGWHGRNFVFNVAYSDGHAAPTFIDGHLHPQPDIGRYADDPSGNRMGYLNYRCIIIRGPDWHLDTLPAAGVTTGIPAGGGSPARPGDGDLQLGPIFGTELPNWEAGHG